MLLRTSSVAPSDQMEAAYEAFRKTQDSAQTLYGIFLQSEHSRLAGALAQALVPEAFGVLNADVIVAIAQHDYGWDCSDQQQIQTLARQRPRPFTEMNAEETLPSWIASIAHGRRLGPLAGVLISRHCCLLGTGSGQHGEFIEQETKRRKQVERLFSPVDLDRWTGALGFCDLLSLYLCSGSQSRVILPLAHPEQTANDLNLTLDWVNGRPALSQPVLRTNASFFANGIRYPGTASTNADLKFQWTFADRE